MTPHVVYWNNIPAPYMVERFNAVARRGNIDFDAWFSARTESGRSWRVDERTWEFEHRYLPSVDRGTYPLALPWPLLTPSVPDVFVSLYAAPAFMFGWMLARARGARTALWVEVTFDALIRRRRWKEALKRTLLPRADGILTAGLDGKDYAMRYSVRDERVFVVPHVIAFEHFRAGSSLSPAEREAIRAQLGLRGVTFAYVGRLWLGKGLKYLLDAFGALQRITSADVSLLLVGDGLDERILRAQCSEQRIENVVFAGFHEGEALARLYAAADVFVFPALGDTFGMVVSEAMASGLPIIATSASGEIAERVSEGVNGFVVPPADSEALRDRMGTLGGDGELRRRMGQASREMVSTQSPEVWAEAFEDAVFRMLEMPRASAVRRRFPIGMPT